MRKKCRHFCQCPVEIDLRTETTKGASTRVSFILFRRENAVFKPDKGAHLLQR